MRYRKIMAVLSAAALAAGVITGCGGASDQTGGESSKAVAGSVTLDFFQMKNEAKSVYDEIIAKFEAENPGVKINQISPADSETVFLTNISTGDIPDIMSVYPAEATYKSIMDEGIMADMTGEKVLENAEATAVKMCEHNGKVYTMPFALSSFGIFCNKDMFEEQNLELPETWDDLIKACQTFEAAGITAIACNDKDSVALGQEAERIIGIIKNDVYNDFETVGTSDASFTDANLPYVRTMAVAMLELRKYGPKDSLAIGREQATSDFVNNKYPMFISGTWGLAAILKAAPEMNLSMVPIPNPAGEVQSLPINGDIALGYSATTEHPEEALKFIEFCARPEINQLLADNEGTPTVIKGVEYHIEPLALMKEKMAGDKTFLTLVNYWPAGMRNEWAIPMQQLLIDQNVDHFLEETDRIVKQYYKES